MAQAPLIAIVGRPNVGKSTLYNRLVGGRPALVHDTPGLTRDRRYGELEYFARKLRVVDTGGLDPEAEQEVIGAGIHRQARAALDEADAVLLVVDARAGVTPLDQEVAAMIRKLGKPMFLAANKVDSPKRDDLALELFRLGLGDPWPISAAHGRGVDELVEALCDALGVEQRRPADVLDALDADAEADDATPEEERPLRVALVGKPNAGKSSLVNRLLGAERALVHHVAGTTTDPIDTELELGGRRYVLVDTAGIRRRTKVDAGIERISVSLALSQIERADIVVLVIDASDGPNAQITKIANRAVDAGRGLVLALNKADLLGLEERRALEKQIDDELYFLDFVPRHLLSAARGDGVLELMSLVDRVAAEHRRRVPTGELNRFFAEVCETHPPPTKGSRRVTIHYLTQGGTRPPTFLFWANHPSAIEPAYVRFLQNQLRARYGFRGTPVRVVIKAKLGREKKPRSKRRGRSRKRH